jgi:site-specific DNA-methyltransferase (adenine-specific)
LQVLRTLSDESVDAVVSDPPYGLSFMGKRWDYDVPSVEIWQQVLRVLKPGGHLLAFAGTRTQHRMAVRIEDAGFEIRDMIAWVYGSGFSKSMDVTKAIDAQDAVQEQQTRRYRFTAWVRSTGVTSKQIDEATQTNMGGHYTTAASQPAIMTREHLEACRHLFSDIPEWVEQECDIRSVESEALKSRAVVGKGYRVRRESIVDLAGRSTGGFDITAPATEAAKQWAGWGTSVRPALEPITWARKPLIGTVAENLLQHRTGAVNVDGCKIDGERLPANFIHDGSEEAVNLLGSAARFFYCAKASKRDRGESNRHPTVKPTALMRYLCRLITPPGGLILDPFTGSGSTGRGAVLEGFRFIGMELDAEHVEEAKRRILEVRNGWTDEPEDEPAEDLPGQRLLF